MTIPSSSCTHPMQTRPAPGPLDWNNGCIGLFSRAKPSFVSNFHCRKPKLLNMNFLTSSHPHLPPWLLIIVQLQKVSSRQYLNMALLYFHISRKFCLLWVRTRLLCMLRNFVMKKRAGTTTSPRLHYGELGIESSTPFSDWTRVNG